MSTIGGLSTSTSSSIRGYGGLASGLDRDTLIEGMTSGTTSKITQQQQKKQQLEWKQEAVRSITDMMLAFANKYTSSWSSKTNLFSSVFWGRNKLSVMGENSKYVSVSGTATSADGVSIMGVKQLAQKAKISTGASSSGKLTSGEIDTTTTNETVQNLQGKTLNFEFGNKTYYITLSNKDKDGKELKYDTMDNTVASIKKLLSQETTTVGDKSVTLDEVIKVENDNKYIKFSKGAEAGSNSLKIKDGTALEYFGISEGADIEKKGSVTGNKDETALNRSVTFAEKVSGRSLTFSYNGVSKDIYIPTLEETDTDKLKTIQESLQKQLDEAFGKDRVEVGIEDAASGKGKLTFRTTLPGTASTPGGENKDDKTSTLQIMGGSSDLIGDSGVLKMQPGASTHLNLYAKISESGLKGITNSTKIPGEIWINDTRIEITADDTLNSLMDKINKNTNVTVSYQAATDKFTFTSKDDGASGSIKFGKTFTDKEIEEIGKNFQDAAVKAEKERILKNAEEGDSFEVALMKEVRRIGGDNAVAEAQEKAKNEGTTLTEDKIKEIRANGEAAAEQEFNDKANAEGLDQGEYFEFTVKKRTEKDAEAAMNSARGNNDLLNAIFQSDKTGVDQSDMTGRSATGQDAIVSVKYAGSDEPVEIVRGTNSFTLDGLTINVKGEFGYVEKKDDDGKVVMEDGKAVMELDKTAEAVEIDAQVDADSIVDAVKAMVDEYNAMIELVNKELTTKPDRDYSPLTSEQKKELSDDEIEAWEKKAKEGLLYADSDIRSLSSDLRFIIGGGIAQELSEMGISTSSTYSDNGKLTFDETKFRAALASNPERVQQLFAESSVTNTNGKGTSTGIATALKNVMDKYVNTMGSMESKGILIRKAGSESAPMSITENTMYKQLKEINDMITKLQERLESERDRYIKQFTSLETLISQMNSQSSFLSQLGGY